MQNDEAGVCLFLAITYSKWEERAEGWNRRQGMLTTYFSAN